MKKFIFLVLFFCMLQTSYAVEFEKLNLPVQIINPGDFYYPLVRLVEKISEKLQFGKDAKFKYSTSLIDKRMSELGFVVKNKRLGELQHSSERLAYQVGVLTDDLIKSGNSQIESQLKIKIKNYFPALSELRDNFPANSSFWLLIQHDINSLSLYLEKLGR